MAGNVEAMAVVTEASGALDTTPPTGSIVINDGDGSTSTTQVTLNLTQEDHMTDLFASVPEEALYQMRLSNDGIWDTEVWEDAMSLMDWTLVGGDGVKTVYYQVMDIVGLVSPTYTDSITLDTTAPTGGIDIDYGAAWTTTMEVTLSISFSGGLAGVVDMRLSNDGVWDVEPWQAPVETMSWRLAGPDGTNTVYLQIRDGLGRVSTTYSDSIVLDTEAPWGSLVINNGDNATMTNYIVLYIEYYDETIGVDSIRVGTDGVWDYESWTSPASTMAFYLEWTGGTQTVYLQVRDAAGHLSETYSDDIILDLDDPECSVEIAGGAERVGSRQVTLTLNYSDATTWVEQVRVSNDGWFDTEPWEEPTTSRSWELSEGDGTRMVYFQVMDAAGRVSDTASDWVTLDTTRPELVSVLPEEESIKVSTDTVVILTFNEAMDTVSVENSFELRGGGKSVMGSFFWSGDGTSVTFTPFSPLDQGTLYHVVVTYGAQDVAGQGIGQELDATFKTIEPPSEVSVAGPFWLWLIVLIVVLMVVALIRPRRHR